MAKTQQPKSAPSKQDGSGDRPNGKAFKKHKGVAPGAHNGKSIGGYSMRKNKEKAEAAASRRGRVT